MMAATVLGRWIQHCVPKRCKIGKYLSLMDIMHSPDAILVHLFSGNFWIFYHKKESHNKSKEQGGSGIEKKDPGSIFLLR